MDFKEMRNTLEKMANDNFEDFTKALISFEKGINDKKSLDKVYQVYMDNDSMGLLNDEFETSFWKFDECIILLNQEKMCRSKMLYL